MIRRLSLRARLLLGVIGLAAAGLVVAELATYTLLRGFLISRTDNSLRMAHVSAEAALRGPGHGGPHDPGGHRGFGSPAEPIGGAPPRRPPPPRGFATGPDIDRVAASVPGLFVQLRNEDGTVLATGAAPQFSGTSQSPPPRLPESIAFSSTEGREPTTYFTVPATNGGGRYRVRASRDPSMSPYTLIVAQSLTGVDNTLHRLALVGVLVTLLVLGGVAALGSWVIRIGLRPLTEIGASAATIAAGDLSHRVAHDDDRTEVGRLGHALNSMLARIETAFHDREASERKLRRFVADASHELRTPLAAVRAYAELFARGAAHRPGDLERSMAGIGRESRRMSLLVGDLLFLARLDEGRPLAREPVALDDVVAEAVETARTLEPGRTIRCRLEPVTFRGDRDRLRQIVDNLFSNVRAHAGRDAGIDVSLTRADRVVKLSVADDGHGMTPEQANHVFERFYRADASRARSNGGTGLGLSIVAAVAEAHGGRATVSAVPGGGAEFTIELPLAGFAPAEDAHEREAARSGLPS